MALVGVIPVGEGDLVLVDLQNPTVDDGGSMDVAGQVGQNGLGPVAGVFDIGHPFGGVWVLGDVHVRSFLADHVEEESPEELGQGPFGKEIAHVGWSASVFCPGPGRRR